MHRQTMAVPHGSDEALRIVEEVRRRFSVESEFPESSSEIPKSPTRGKTRSSRKAKSTKPNAAKPHLVNDLTAHDIGIIRRAFAGGVSPEAMATHYKVSVATIRKVAQET